MVGMNWDPIITLLAFFAPLGAIQAIMTTVGAIYMAKGRTRLMLGWTIAASIVVIMAFVIGLQSGIVGVAIAYTIASALLMYPGFVIPFRLINLSFTDLVRILWQPLVASLVMTMVVGSVDYTFLNVEKPWLRLLVGILMGAVVYLSLVWIMYRKQALYVLDTLRGR